MSEFIDFYIQYEGHPKFIESELIEDDIVRIVVQKYELICGTNKGEVYGDYNFGADLEALVHQTQVSAKHVEDILNEQIYTYIPEVANIGYSLKAQFAENFADGSELLVLEFKINGYEIYLRI